MEMLFSGGDRNSSERAASQDARQAHRFARAALVAAHEDCRPLPRLHLVGDEPNEVLAPPSGSVADVDVEVTAPEPEQTPAAD